MRRLALLALLAAVLAACGSSSTSTAAKSGPIVFGVSGGNVRPFHKEIPAAQAGSLQRKVRAAFAAGLASRQCPGTLPDVATMYIRFAGRTVRVHGACEPAFTRLWNALSASRS